MKVWCSEASSRAGGWGSVHCTVGRSFLGGERVVDQRLEGGQDAATLVLGLLQHDVEHVQAGIDAEIGAAAAVPFEFADRAWRRRFGVSRIGAYAKAVAIAEAIAGKVVVIPPNAGARPNVVCRHRLECRRAEIALAVEFSAVE